MLCWYDWLCYCCDFILATQGLFFNNVPLEATYMIMLWAGVEAERVICISFVGSKSKIRTQELYKSLEKTHKIVVNKDTKIVSD